MLITEAIKYPWPFLSNGPRTTPEKVYAFSPDDTHRHLLTVVEMFIEKSHGPSENVGIEPATQASITGDHQQFRFIPGSLVEERMGCPAGMFAQIGDYSTKFMGIGSGRQDPVLRTLEFGRGDHLHRFRNLLGIFNGSDFPSEVL